VDLFPVGEIYPYFKTFSALRLTQPHNQRVHDALSSGVKRPGSKTDAIFYLALRLRILGAKTPLPSMS
jgi:hypothetical protein